MRTSKTLGTTVAAVVLGASALLGAGAGLLGAGGVAASGTHSRHAVVVADSTPAPAPTTNPSPADNDPWD
jgi:hypothetical protein